MATWLTIGKVGHGHILRPFTKGWLGYSMEFPLSMMIEPGGVRIPRSGITSMNVGVLLMYLSAFNHQGVGVLAWDRYSALRGSGEKVPRDMSNVLGRQGSEDRGQ